MPDLSSAAVSIASCFGSPAAIDSIASAERVHRTAPDEAIAVDESASALQEQLRVTDADALVMDTTDGWAAFVLSGRGSRDVFACVSELELPSVGFAQGDCARVPVKVFAESERLTILVPAMWGAYLQQRLEESMGAK